ncbi:MAG: MarR family transcriptional regulator [Candidatus Omnitrophica bacterium]|nr:MarR family transcriptional regulator [Candidatus Omnitrophota bacterium]
MSLTIEQFIERMNQIIPRFIRKVHVRQSAIFIKGDLSIPQFLVLELIGNAGRIKMCEVAAEMRISRPAVTGIVDRLAKLDLLTRLPSEADRRVIFIQLTKRGQALIQKVRSQRAEVIKVGFSALSPDERETYVSILEKVTGILTGG